MNHRTPFESRRIHHEDPQIHTIVPGDSKRVVLLSSKSRGSDWDLAVEQDSNGVESEDSGFQVDVDSSKITANDAVVTGVTKMTVTTKKVFFIKIFIIIFIFKAWKTRFLISVSLTHVERNDGD